jgi:molybdopterin molybdotransferase
MAEPMLPLEAAISRLLAMARRTDAETVALTDAVGRALVQPLIVAPIDVPGFANSSMDGYAIRAADAPGRLRLVGEIHAGAAELPLVEPGTAARIMTGAPLPPGADAVVPIEDASEGDGRVTMPAAVASGAFVRAAGHDTRAGDEVCLPGDLTPAKIAVLASLGIGAVEVRRRPVVAILSTGDELIGPGQPPRPGQIHDANGPSLAAAVAEAGGVPQVLPRIGDDEAAIERALIGAAGSGDLVVASGGVSVGRRDFVRAVLERRGALDFWRIAVQPGKPLAVGALDGTPIIGLPGNPVSALVTFELFARPLLRVMAGLAGDGRLHVRVTPTEPMTKDRPRRAFLRVVVFADGDVLRARPAGGQASSQLRPMGEANALLAVPEGVDAALPGETYDAVLLEPVGR